MLLLGHVLHLLCHSSWCIIGISHWHWTPWAVFYDIKLASDLSFCMHCILNLLWSSWLCLAHMSGCYCHMVGTSFCGWTRIFSSIFWVSSLFQHMADRDWLSIDINHYAVYITILWHVCCSIQHCVEHFVDAISSCVIIYGSLINSIHCSMSKSRKAHIKHHWTSNSTGTVMHLNPAIMTSWHI